MLVTRADFEAAFPEFKDTGKFPDASVNLWLDDGEAILSEATFGTRRKLAIMLYAAHNLMLGQVTASGSVGVSLAPTASKSVGPVSKSYDTGLTSYQNAGVWNATPYGQRFWAMIRGLTAGPFYRPSVKAFSVPRFGTRGFIQ